VQNAVRAFETTTGTITDRVNGRHGSRRRRRRRQPLHLHHRARPERTVQHAYAHVAYLLAADRNDTRGVSHDEGQYSGLRERYGSEHPPGRERESGDDTAHAVRRVEAEPGWADEFGVPTAGRSAE